VLLPFGVINDDDDDDISSYCAIGQQSRGPIQRSS